MNRNKLKAAVLGLKEGGELGQCSAKSQYFDITAVAEKEVDFAEQIARQYDCQWFDDYRQFIMNCKADCLLVAAGLYSCESHIRLAIEKGLHIFKLHPPGQNFGQVAELLQCAKNKNVTFAVSVPMRYSESFAAFSNSIRESTQQEFTLVTSNCSYSSQGWPAWHNDPELAGGGVLLRDCYEIVDLLVSTFGVPEQVYALVTNSAEDRQQRHALTEDSAVVSMKFANELCTNLVARRTTGPEKVTQTVNCYGREKVLSAGDDYFELKKSTGEIIEKKKFDNNKQDKLSKALENFALSILEPQENRLICQPQEHLKNMAVIEAAYLSSRTGMPEEPARILEFRV